MSALDEDLGAELVDCACDDCMVHGVSDGARTAAMPSVAKARPRERQDERDVG